MSTLDSRFRLTQSGDTLRVMVQRLSDLSLLSLHEVARALNEGTGRAPETVEGLDVATVATTLQDVSGSLCLADIRARRSALEQPSDKQTERDELLNGLTEAVASGKADESRTLLAVILEKFPGDSLVSVAAGCVHWALGDLGKARQYFVRAQSPEADTGLKADALYLQAVVSAEMGEVDLAVNLLARTAVTEESLEETWTRPAARARYEQARLIATQFGASGLADPQTERCRTALFQAIESNGYFFAPAYVEPAFSTLQGLRDELQERFDAISIQAHLLANAGDALVREFRVKRLVDHDTLQRAREVFDAPGYFSRSKLMTAGVRTVVKIRDAAVANLTKRLEDAVNARDEAYAQAESTRRSGEEAAVVEIEKGAQTTRALDMRAFAIRDSTSDRFRLSEPLEAQHEQLSTDTRAARNKRFIIVGVAATVLLAAAVILVPGVAGKIIAATVLAGAAAWLLYSGQRRYRADLVQLDEELRRAHGAKATEMNLYLSAQQTQEQTQAQSQQVRQRAEGERQMRIERADERFNHEIWEVRRLVEALVQANERFFRTIDRMNLPEAQFTPPNVDDLPPPTPAAG